MDSHSRAKQAYFTLRQRILRAEYPFGTILSPRRLARQFGMSLVPVAEALQRLEQEGLVERRSRAGTRVKIPTPDEIMGLYVVREALESQAARLCAVHATAAERIMLRTLAEELDRLFSEKAAPSSSDRKSPFQRHTKHLKFHALIAEFGRCQTLCQAIERNHVLLFNFLYDIASRRTVLPPRFHSELIEPIIRGDPEKADAVMRHHVTYGLSETLSRLRPQIQKNFWRIGEKNGNRNGRLATAQPEKDVERDRR
jgi:GntR family transcriptional regulator, rspAB operon transcriptional repressor